MAVALAQQAGSTDGTGSGTTLAVPATTTTGSLLVLCVSWLAGDTTTITVADSNSVSWTRASKGDKSGSTGTRTEIWYLINAAAITSVTVTQSAASVKSATLLEYSGFGAGTLELGNTNTTGGAATPALTSTLAPTAGDVMVASLNLNNTAAITVVTSGGFVAATQTGTVAGNRMAAAYKLSSTTSESESWTFASGTKNWGATIAAFKPAAATGAALAGTAAGVGTMSGSLTTAITMAGSAAGVATLSGALSTGIPLAGAVTGQSTAGASTLSAPAAALAGSSAGSATGIAAITTAINLGATAAGVGAGSGGLTTAILLASATTGAAGASGGLTTAIRLAGTSTAAGTATASLGMGAAALAGSLAGVAAVGAALTTAIRLVAVAAGIGSASVDLTTGALVLDSVTLTDSAQWSSALTDSAQYTVTVSEAAA